MNAVLNADAREATKSKVKKLRNEGYIPAILYGDGITAQAITVNEREFLKVYREVGRSGVLSLQVADESYPAMVYELQVDPIKNNVLHADFYKVDMNVEVDAEIPVLIAGSAPGEKDGGVMQQSVHALNIRALPGDLPSSIEVSIDELQIGDSIQVENLPTSDKYTILNNEDETIVAVLQPSMEEEEETDVSEVETDEEMDAEEEETEETDEE